MASTEVTMYTFNKDRKIAAIKFVRATGKLLGFHTGLKQAKSLVDIMERTGRPISFGMVDYDQLDIIRLAADTCSVELVAPNTRPIHASDYPGVNFNPGNEDIDDEDMPF